MTATPNVIDNRDERLNDLALVRQAHLSAMAVDAGAWALFCPMGGARP